MKKAIIIFTLALCMSVNAKAEAKVITPKDLNPKATETELFTDANTREVKGKICKIRKGKQVSIYVKADKRRYKIILSKGEYADWIEEQGKVRKGTRVILWLYTMETKNKADDVVLNIRK